MTEEEKRKKIDELNREIEVLEKEIELAKKRKELEDLKENYLNTFIKEKIVNLPYYDTSDPNQFDFKVWC